ncbi:hypothetical protein, partial [Mailhella sp.]|uniref:hypothetical protein n=1 Tax=Mailhella sp. TaxID=1981029 RepID=UPI003AB58EE2
YHFIFSRSSFRPAEIAFFVFFFNASPSRFPEICGNVLRDSKDDLLLPQNICLSLTLFSPFSVLWRFFLPQQQRTDKIIIVILLVFIWNQFFFKKNEKLSRARYFHHPPCEIMYASLINDAHHANFHFCEGEGICPR